jgi:predicted amidohydrolase
MIVATVNFSMQHLSSPEEFWRRFRLLTEQARDRGAEIVLFPEYFSLPWLVADGGNFGERLQAAADLEARFVEEARRAAAEYRIGVIAGTVPHVENKTEIRNRCWICLPGKEPIYQDKVNMTRFEAEEWKIAGGANELRVFEWAGARCAVATCYDVEFPAYCAAAAEARVDVLFVPSCTDDVHGYWRVRHCAEARAVENQCFVVMSSVVEGDPRYPEIGAHYGRSCILSPCDVGFPESGCIVEARANAEDVVEARLELRALAEIRKNGTVLNLRDGKSTVKPKVLEG